MGRPILERERELAELGAAARQAKGGDGSIVLIVGEAGIGKSSLVGAVRSVLPAEGRLLVGYCDDLATPRVLGPLRDLVGSVGTALTEALESGDRGRVIDALRAELDWPGHPTVLVIEDVHWADEATLDVLRFLARRLATMPVALVLTYRDEQLTVDHPLQQLLGLSAAAPRLRRLRLARLSAQAVRKLGEHTGLDTDEVFAVTSGNPFFVAEVLASGDLRTVPPTIAEAVRARLRDLDGPTRDAIERLAVVPSAVQRWLVEAVVPGGLASLAAAEQRGVLTVSPNRITFRHELLRRAIVDWMPAARRVACNQAVLAALLARPGGADLSRIMHHATEAGDDQAIIEYGPAAAREAVAAGSHREAVAHYRAALDHRAAYPPAEQAELLQGYAVECYTTGLADLAVRAQQDAVRLRRDLGSPREVGLGLRWLSRMHWWAGNRPAAEAGAAEAIEILERAGDRHALAMALSNQSQLHTLAGRRAESIAVGERAVAMARDTGDAGLLSHALNNVGFARWDDGQPQGRAMLEESLAVALRAREVEHACRAYVNIVWHLLDDLELDDAARFLQAGIELADDAEFLGFLRYLHVTRGMLHLARSEWDDAERAARWAVDAQPIMRCPALVVLGRAQIRRGQQAGAELIAEAWEIAKKLGEPQRIAPAAAALIEAAWLIGDAPVAAGTVAPAAASAAAEVADWYDGVHRFGSPANAAELGYWARLAGLPVPVAECDHPYATLAAGQWRAAADRWQRAGCPYQHATALAQSPDPDDLMQALITLDALGAEPLARRVRLRLRELGVTRIPRGPMPATRSNPAGLTGRQVEVVRLIAEGLSNAEIAARLMLSVRTVDTHVAAILDKLNARTRRDAATQATALGLVARR
jgi:DNA-binding CsgD family transcriptional regulator/tetratricopeptide (TPR) repeat protein/energy-coupling factor transporter ATP-binding protein EcfA2